MSDETPDPATDEPKAETLAHAPTAPAEDPPPAPEVEAGVAEETSPDPEHAPEPETAAEPEPAPPPELAEVVAAVAEVTEVLPTDGAGSAPAPSDTHADAEPEPQEEPPAKPAKKSRTKSAKPAATTEIAPEAVVTEAAADAVPDESAAADATEEAPAEAPPENKKKWYAVKVQSGREDTIKAAILRKVAIEGLEEFFGEIAIPFEEVIEKKQVKVKDKKTGESSYQEKKVTKRKKKFHGYIFANVVFNDRILYLFRETSGVGDFLNVRGSPGAPAAEPMPEHEVTAMLTGVAQKDPSKRVKIKLDFEKGDKVRIREGSFANNEGEVKAIIEAKDPNEAPKVTVVLVFWGRPLDVELEANQVEKV